jgi:hypothetical protein
MMKFFGAHKRVVQWSVFGATFLFSAACQSVDKGHAEVRLPPNSKLGIVIGEDSNLTVYDREGNRAVACNLCSAEMEQKFGPYCEKAPPDANLCDAVTTATVQDVDSVVIMKSHKNPHCVTIKVGGSYYSYPSPCRH